ncbi:MAG: ABC transporter substrate-binding protein [Thiopseudomonas sp.]|nr:ABC transporter substrate-binding protein [Thiopseudomonas sp.]
MCGFCNDPEHNGFGRRDFLKLAGLFTAAGAFPLLSQLQQAQAAQPDAPLRIGYLPITDAAPLLVAHHQGLFADLGLQVEKPRMFRSWAQLVEAFLSGSVNLVHVLAPMAIWSRYGSGAATRVVAWNHINGSSLTVAAGQGIDRIEDLGGKTLAIPFWYSIHNVVLQLVLRKHGLEPVTQGTPNPKQVLLSVMAPSDMLPGLAAGSIAGYIVAEPFNAAAELNGLGKVLRFTGDVWKDHACCVVQMHEADLEQRPEWSQKVVSALVQAQAWMRDHREDTVNILAKDNPASYTPHSRETLAQVLLGELANSPSGLIQHPDWQQQRIDFKPYPFASYTEQLVELLKQTEVKGSTRFLQKLDPAQVARDLVDDRFVRQAIADVGGMGVFGLPDSFQREEIIQP